MRVGAFAFGARFGALRIPVQGTTYYLLPTYVLLSSRR